MAATVLDALSDGGELRSVIGVNGDDDPGLYLKPELEDLDIELQDHVAVVLKEEERRIVIDVGPDRTEGV